VLSLLQTSREWPGSELAKRLQVSPRTIRRDVDRLRELGYPVEATMGAFGGYRLVAGTAMPPLLLDDEEAVAIAIGLRITAKQPIAGIEEASVRALAKLQQVLPTPLRRRVAALNTATVPTPGWDRATVDPEHLAVLATAIANQERVRFDCRAGDGTGSRRLVEPHRLVAAGRRWYLVAYDSERHDWRTFRIDRINGPQPTGVHVAPRQLPAADAATYVTDQLYDLAPTHRAVATLHAPMPQLMPMLGDGPGTLTPLDARTCRWHSQPDTVDWLAFRLTTLAASSPSTSRSN
jgi:predicted DNA-binding transcriptional regulator YafY